MPWIALEYEKILVATHSNGINPHNSIARKFCLKNQKLPTTKEDPGPA